MTNGATHEGEILQDDVDVWTFTATAGERLSVHIGEITDTDDFRPWIRVWTPTGGTVGDAAGVSATAVDDIVAPSTGTYLVQVASFDTGFDGEWTSTATPSSGTSLGPYQSNNGAWVCRDPAPRRRSRAHRRFSQSS